MDTGESEYRPSLFLESRAIRLNLTRMALCGLRKSEKNYHG